MTKRAALALVGLGGILVVTTAWWTLALWPPDPALPAWVERTRAACFGVAPNGLPHAGGWLLLVGEPLGMLAFLLFAWGDAVREGLSALARSRAGRLLLAAGAAVVLVGTAAAATRVRNAWGERFDATAGSAASSAAARRVDAPPPPLVLVDQTERRTTLADFAGRPVLVAFAYGHCETVCPAIVHDATGALRDAAVPDAVLLVVTLDPWRDTPARLAAIAKSWQLPGGARLLGGSVAEVESVLDAWGVARRRDESTGEIIHSTEMFLVDRGGRLAWITSSDRSLVAKLLRDL
ncbi:MAG: SCO family protein [Gemmatimonadaceae bacterium]